MNQILVHQQGADALIRIIGRGSFKNSVTLRDYSVPLMDQLQETSQVLLDMRDCEGLDSTFMGMLAKWSNDLAQAGKPGLVMIDVREKVAECITTLGLGQVIAWSPMGESPNPYRQKVDACKEWEQLEEPIEESELDTAHRMFVAHEKLVDIEESNHGRFKDVLDYLGQKIGKKTDEEGP